LPVFKSEKTNKVVGYAFEEASHSLFESDILRRPMLRL